VVVGAGYVQALLTAPADVGCPPRVQRAGHCVRTPAAGSGCAAAPECVTALRVLAPDGALLGSSNSALARVGPLPAAIRLEVLGCGGPLALDLDIGTPTPGFAAASGQVDGGSIRLDWSPAGEADLVCALWRWHEALEVCCVADSGEARFDLPPGSRARSARLSRGRLVSRVAGAGGTSIDVFRTAESPELLGPSTGLRTGPAAAAER
jgi:hypothetical protein